MARVIITLLAFGLTTTSLPAQSISTLHVGDPSSTLRQLSFRTVAKDSVGSKETVKFELPKGNELSVTFDSISKRIVYIECDWGRDPDGAETDFPGFRFGTTTLEDIRKMAGNNGFSYQRTAMSEANGQIITFNAYPIKGRPGLVVVFVTVLNIDQVVAKLGREPTQAEMPKHFKLDALILAEETYLDLIWRKEKIYDKVSGPIAWEEKGNRNKKP